MKYLFYLTASILFLTASSTLSAQTPEQLRSWLPEVNGWTIDEKIETFNPQNLFNRINGAAPLFIENNFREMTSMQYIRGEDRITIQAYRHAGPEDAFGMYASERSSGLNSYPIGGESQGDSESMYFFAGNIYVKMWANSEEDVSNILQTIASSLAKGIDKNAGYPAVVAAMPSKDMTPYSQAYITANYIGHEFLKGVYTADYKKGGKVFQLFVIDGKTIEGAKEILTKYFTFNKQPLEFNEGKLTINDRFNGEMPAIWKGRYIIGIFSESGDIPDGSGELLNEMSEKL